MKMMFTHSNRTHASLPVRFHALLLPLVCIIGVFFELFSIGSTATGFDAFFNGFSELPRWFAWAIIVAIAAGLHCLAIAWFLRARQTRLRKALLPYLFLVPIFIGLSWSWHWQHFQAPDVSKADYQRESADVEHVLVVERDAMTLMVAKTQRLAEYSDKRATEEENFGHTCGDASGKTRGKRFQVRMMDRD